MQNGQQSLTSYVVSYPTQVTADLRANSSPSIDGALCPLFLNSPRRNHGRSLAQLRPQPREAENFLIHARQRIDQSRVYPSSLTSREDQPVLQSQVRYEDERHLRSPLGYRSYWSPALLSLGEERTVLGKARHSETGQPN